MDLNNLQFPFMESLKAELYGNDPEPDPEQQPHTLGGQARALEQEIGLLFEQLVCLKPWKLMPQLIGIIRSLKSKLGKVSRKLNGWKAPQPEEHYLMEMQGFPTLLFKEL